MEQYIILAKNGVMAWSANNEQLCYVNNEVPSIVDGKLFTLESYLLETAQLHITNSNKFRTENGFELVTYQLVKIDLSSFVNSIQNILLKHLQTVKYPNNYPIEAVPKATILELPKLLK